MVFRTPLALIASSKPQTLAEMIAMLNRAGYSCIGYGSAGEVPVD